MLVVPLREGLGKTLSQPGNYEVKIKWSLLYSPDLKDRLYTRYTEKTLANSSVPQTMKTSFVWVARNASHTGFQLSVKD